MSDYKIIREQVRCPRCSGKGRVFNTMDCVCTGGVAFVLGLIDPELRDRCPECKGAGWIWKTTEIRER